jgi:hypothetical protein
MSRLGDDSVESVVMVSGVVDYPGGAIRFNQAVVPLHLVTIPLLGLFLDIMGVVISDSVFELVMSRCLKYLTEV